MTQPSPRFGREDGDDIDSARLALFRRPVTANDNDDVVSSPRRRRIGQSSSRSRLHADDDGHFRSGGAAIAVLRRASAAERVDARGFASASR